MQFPDSENAFHDLKIVEFPRLCGTQMGTVPPLEIVRQSEKGREGIDYRVAALVLIIHPLLYL